MEETGNFGIEYPERPYSYHIECSTQIVDFPSNGLSPGENSDIGFQKFPRLEKEAILGKSLMVKRLLFKYNWSGGRED